MQSLAIMTLCTYLINSLFSLCRPGKGEAHQLSKKLLHVLEHCVLDVLLWCAEHWFVSQLRSVCVCVESAADVINPA